LRQTLIRSDKISFYALSFLISIKKGRQMTAARIILRCSGNGRRLAKIFLLHRYAPAATANIFHRSQLVFAQMGVIRLRSPAEAAFGFIAARIAQVTGFVGDRSAIFTCIGHW
jgi:hypothetical protein